MKPPEAPPIGFARDKRFSLWERAFLFPFILGLLIGWGMPRWWMAGLFALFGWMIGFAMGRL